MDTDKEFQRIFATFPEWLFELIKKKSPGKVAWRPFTVKALQHDADGLIVPVNRKQPITIVEFQFQRDRSIYNRVVIEMAAAQEEFGGRDVEGRHDVTKSSETVTSTLSGKMF